MPYEVFTRTNGKLIPVKLLEMWRNTDGNRFVSVETADQDLPFVGGDTYPIRTRFSTVETASLVIVRVGRG